MDVLHPFSHRQQQDPRNYMLAQTAAPALLAPPVHSSPTCPTAEQGISFLEVQSIRAMAGRGQAGDTQALTLLVHLSSHPFSCGCCPGSQHGHPSALLPVVTSFPFALGRSPGPWVYLACCWQVQPYDPSLQGNSCSSVWVSREGFGAKQRERGTDGRHGLACTRSASVSKVS